MNQPRQASPELEARLDWAHAEARKLGFAGFGRFEQMRRMYGSLDACERLVVNGTLQSGFTWCIEKGRPDISVEQAVVDFASEFSNPAIAECARWRLEAAKAGVRN